MALGTKLLPSLNRLFSHTSSYKPTKAQAQVYGPLRDHAGNKYHISGSEMHVLQVDLNPGESIIAEPRCLMSMSEGVTMEIEARGGLMAGWKRMLGEKSPQLTSFRYEGDEGVGRIFLSPKFYSKIYRVKVTPELPMICQSTAFLCGEDTLTIDDPFTGALKEILNQSGLHHQKFTGTGYVFVKTHGAMFTRYLRKKESILTYPGCMVGYEPTVRLKVDTNTAHVKGGILMTLTGPGNVILQSMSSTKFAAAVTEKAGEQKEVEKAESEEEGVGSSLLASLLGKKILAAEEVGDLEGYSGSHASTPDDADDWGDFSDYHDDVDQEFYFGGDDYHWFDD